MEKINLHQHMIEEIFKELPVKSLMRFKCLSKLWKSLICGSPFLKLHREAFGKKYLLLSTNNKPINKLMLLDYDEASFVDINLNFTSDEKHRSIELVGLNFTSDEKHLSIELVGSCNGLIALLYDKDLFLWNPLTRERKKLPSPCTCVLNKPFNCVYSIFYCVSYSGFGYDPSSDDYKLILEFKCQSQQANVAIFSLKTESWRMLETPFPPLYESGIHLNGSLHWLPKGKDILLAFDLRTETFGKIPVPNHLSNLQQFGVFDGKLCVTEYNYQEKHLQLWLMNEYGDDKSWIKLLTLETNVYDLPECIYDLPLCISKDNTLIYMQVLVASENEDDTGRWLYTSGRICKLYHPQYRLTCCNINEKPIEVYGAVLYQESLVSPNSNK